MMVWNTGSTFQSTCEDDPETLDPTNRGLEPESLNSFGDFVIIDGEAKVSDAFIAQPFIVIPDQNRTASEIERDQMIYSPGLRLIGSPIKELSYELRHRSNRPRQCRCQPFCLECLCASRLQTEKWGTWAATKTTAVMETPPTMWTTTSKLLGARHKFRLGRSHWEVNSQVITLGTNSRPWTESMSFSTTTTLDCQIQWPLVQLQA